MKRFALVGANIEKSLSPLLHKIIFDYCGISATYELLPCENIDEDTVKKLKTFDGFNVTQPFKHKLAKRFGSVLTSVNTVEKRNDNFLCYSTDGDAVELLLKKRKLDIINKRLLIIGGGGAANAVAKALSKYTLDIEIFNRTFSKAEEIAAEFNLKAVEKPSGTYFGILSFVNVEKLLIDKCLIEKAEFVLDSYYFAKTDLMRYSTTEQKIDGLEMLFYQGLLAEIIWNKIDLSDLELERLLSKFLKGAAGVYEKDFSIKRT